MNTDRTEAVEVGVTLGLFAACSLHDAEEVAMMPRWTRIRLPELRERIPGVPEALWTRLESMDGRRFARSGRTPPDDRT